MRLLSEGRSLRAGVHSLCRRQFVRCVGWYVMHSLCTLASPLLVYYLLWWLGAPGEAEWRGYVCVVGLGVSNFCAAALRRWSALAGLEAGLRARTALCELAFVRAEQTDWASIALRTSRADDTCGREEAEDMASAPLGRLSELMGSSASRVTGYFSSRATIMLLPAEAFVCIAILYAVVGNAGLGGVAAMAAFFLFSHFGGRQGERAATRQSVASSSFATVLSECLHGLQTIRLAGWTPIFEERLYALASDVQRCTDRIQCWVNATDPPINTAVDVISCVLVLLLIPMGRMLTPEMYCSYWVMLAILHGRMIAFPVSVAAYRQGHAALQDFDRFLTDSSRGSRVPPSKDAAHPHDISTTTASPIEHVTAGPVEHQPGAVRGRAGDSIRRSWAGAVLQAERRAANHAQLQASGGICPPLEVRVEHGTTIQWPGSGESGRLCCDGLTLPAGGLTVLAGPVGGGKSSLLLLLLDEAPINSGGTTFRVPQASQDASHGTASARPQVAFVAQQPWLLNASVRENILWDDPLPFDADRYANVCRVCCLGLDLAALPDGDRTNVGDGGERLSGGQRQRVSLARAAYSRTPLVLLDDCLSALDPPVAAKVFEECLMGWMSNRTRVLVSHALPIAARADLLLVVAHSGVAVRTPPCPTGAASPEHGDHDQAQSCTMRDSAAVTSTAPSEPPLGEGDAASRHATGSLKAVGRSSRHATGLLTAMGRSISSFGYAYHELLGGGWPSAVNALLMMLETAAVEAGVFLLSSFAEQNVSGTRPSALFFVGLYGATVALEVGLAYIRNLVQAFGCRRSSVRLTREMIARTMNAPLEFYDSMPVGAQLSLFAGDLEACSGVSVQQQVSCFAYASNYGFFISIASCVVLPWNTFAVVATYAAIGVLLFRSRHIHTETSRGSERQAALFRDIVELMYGLSTVRAYRSDPMLFERFSVRLHADSRAVEATERRSKRHFMLVECVGGGFFTAVALFVAIGRRNGVGLDVSSFILLNAAFGASITHLFVVSQMAIADFAAKRRHIRATMAPRHRSPTTRPGGSVGELAVKIVRDGANGTAMAPRPSVELSLTDVCLAYPHCPPVIRGLTLHVRGGERLGVVGRTGSGKSSLLRAMCGLLRCKEGLILMDHRPIDEWDEAELRRDVCVIPQTPHLFAGTIRFNLDPVQAFSDAALWEACEHAQAAAFVRATASALDTPISSTSLSGGQRQLLCLARAMLQQARLVLLDEATSALDDALMQKIDAALAAVAQSRTTTVLVAHQTAAVMSCDRVIVMDHGKVAEEGVPKALLQDKRGRFAELVRQDLRRQEAHLGDAPVPKSIDPHESR